MEDRYFVISRESRVEIKVKGSRFIGEALTAQTVEEAQEKLQAVRKREYDASHHCFAWKVGLFDETAFKYSDDGEPSGTAGKPIYDVLEGNDVTNTLIIVTRYFGGTKLGTGGLVRAYGEGARQALEQAGRSEQFLTKNVRILVDFSSYDKIQNTIARYSAHVIDSEFSDSVRLEVEVRRSAADSFTAELIEQTSGRISIEEVSD